MTIASKAATKGIVSIDLDRRELKHTQNGSEKKVTLDGPEAFEIVSQIWLRSGWASKYSYSFTWMGRPIIQIPEDMVRVQELIFQLKPDVIVEAGIAHGGSLIFYASLTNFFYYRWLSHLCLDMNEHELEHLVVQCHF